MSVACPPHTRDDHAEAVLTPCGLVGLPVERFELIVERGYPHGGLKHGRIRRVQIAGCSGDVMPSLSRSETGKGEFEPSDVFGDRRADLLETIMGRLLLGGSLPDARWPGNGLASTMHYRNGKPAMWWRSEPVVTPRHMPGTSPACSHVRILVDPPACWTCRLIGVLKAERTFRGHIHG